MMSETTLIYQVFVAPITAIAGKDVPPGQSRSTWSPISATLIAAGMTPAGPSRSVSGSFRLAP